MDIGAVLKAHFRILCDRIDGGAPGDGSHIIGAPSACGHFVGVQGVDDGGKYLNGV